MKKQKQNLYLSELFLDNLGDDFSRDSVLNALGKCDSEVLERLGGPHKGLFGQLSFPFFKHTVPKNILQECSDFWDVFSEFDSMITPGMRKNYFILQLC